MTVVTCDFETAWDTDYSLTKMSEVDYILDSRFEVILTAIKVDDQPTEIFVGYQAAADRFAKVDWKNTAFLSHNTRYDGGVLAWVFGHRPALYLDTLSMARAVTHWETGSSSLAALANYFGFPPKGSEVENTKGLRLKDFTPDHLERFKDYCAHDNELCRAIFDRLRPAVPNPELRLIDLFLRMFIEPQVVLDRPVLETYLGQVRRERTDAIRRVATMPEVRQLMRTCMTRTMNDPDVLLKKVLSSNPKFASLLELLKVPVPMKTSPTTGEPIPALAKNDRGFRELCEDQNQPVTVQAVLAARIGAKSTLEETRAGKLLDLSTRPWPDYSCGWAPVPMKYYGARTGRPSGDSGLNWLNFKRGAMVREGITAPDGYRVVHRDSSQIEARMVAWLAGCKTIVDAFAAGRDVYCDFGGLIFGRPITKADMLQRFISKTAILGLGYGCGWAKFRHMLYIGSGGVSHAADEGEAMSIVDKYRATYPEIVGLWRECDRMLRRLAEPGKYWSGWSFSPDTRLDGLIAPVDTPTGLKLPNKMLIHYPGLRTDRDPATQQEEIIYYSSSGKSTVKIYGAKVVENISQALARIVVTDIMLRVYKQTGRHPFLTTYDSLDYCVPACEAERWNDMLGHEFSIAPSWAAGLPLASEGGYGKSLLAAEDEHHEGHNR